MKHITKLLLLAILVVFASCQNETLNEGASSIVEEELSMEDQILVSDGEEDETFVLNNDLEGEMPVEDLTFSLSSNTYGHHNGGSDSNSGGCTPDLEALELSLPETISIKTTANPGDDAYFDFDILNTDLAATGLKGWCVDVDLDLGVEGPLDFDVYSSYEDLPQGKFENPENFDKVNWIMNQNFIGQESPTGGTYTFGHVQWAIWELIDDTNCALCTYITNPIGTWVTNATYNREKAREILQLANDNGEGFVPGCGEKVAVILIPEGKQAIFYMVDVPEKEEECSDCEGKVTKLDLKFDWWRSKKIDILQRRENSCYGKWIYSNRCVKPGEVINLSGANHDGTFGKYIYIYINGCYYTKIKTDCDVNIGPGYYRGVFNVVSGESSNGGELCEYVPSSHYSCKRYWWRH
ncbi:hypothetical protein [Algibacter sp. PT7-4]|uniref:hypothetical protein n=1 Tax=Algibacter ulvanivorans TaxID=3400999 RepID=UPI003AAF33D9